MAELQNGDDERKEPKKKVTICQFDGTLLRDTSFFPYYMLMALEAGGPLRALVLLLLSPITWLISACLSEAISIEIQVFIVTAGLKLSELRSAAMAVLPKFFLEDLEPAVYRAYVEAQFRCIITSHPKAFVEPFLKYYMHADAVLATELQVTKAGVCTGFVAKSGVLHGDKKHEAVKVFFGDVPPQYGIRLHGTCHGFLAECKETIVLKKSRSSEKVPREQYLTPLVFHDGRLVMRPTPFVAFAVLLWVPIGFTLAIARIITGHSLPQEVGYPLGSLLGVRLRVKGAPPVLQGKEGALFVCTHRTLADPTILAMAMRRKDVRTVVYSVSKITEYVSLIKSTRLTRNREEDMKIMDKLLEKVDLIVCPEGTTCREPYLLRFSPLFADLADLVVPVATRVRLSIFHATTARGNKFFDPFFLLMNPRPYYEVMFLDPISVGDLRANGKTAIEIANLLQKQLGEALGYECTNYNRKDKYFLLAGNDGNVQK